MEEKIKNILEIAIHAPSGDNSQPWNFSIQGSTCTIHLIDKDNPYLNHNLSGTLIAHGALIENIVQLAQSSGLVATADLLPDKTNSKITAKIIFEKSSTQNEHRSFNKEDILRRATNRKPFYSKPIPDEIKNILQNTLITEAEKTKIITSFVFKPEFFKSLGRSASTMEEVVFNNKTLHREFFKNFIWSQDEEKEKKTGLYIKTLEVAKPIEMIFRIIKRWKMISILNKIKFNEKIAEDNAKIYAQAGGFGLLSLKEYNQESMIILGRVLERMWLFLNKEGIEFQLVTGVLFLGSALKNDTPIWISNVDKKKILAACDNIRNIFSISIKEVPLILFRFGYAPRPSAMTSRYSLSELIIK